MSLWLTTTYRPIFERCSSQVIRGPASYGMSYLGKLFMLYSLAGQSPKTNSRGNMRVFNGLVSELKCAKDDEHLPNPDRIGDMGWPCFRGGAVPVHYNRDSATSQRKSCMVFYSPVSFQNFHEVPSSQPFTRLERYQEVVMYCFSEEKKQPVISLSKFAVCIMNTYPDGVRGKKSHLYRLRGVAVVLGCVPGSMPGKGYAAALSNGKVVVDCISASLPVAEFQLCHAALFSSVEYDSSSKPSRQQIGSVKAPADP